MTKKELRLAFALQSLRKFKKTKRRLSARKDNMQHFEPEEDPLLIKDIYKWVAVGKQIDSVAKSYYIYGKEVEVNDEDDVDDKNQIQPNNGDKKHK